ncbi:MAG: hypothetical protein M1826_000954 [Phylliscum demangeonii]|nr:MAG: hypothetical protein M1826_000954 [Phylliscum demangeonii]
MAWSLDFCLACDRQTTGAFYCSQACRLTDLDRASSCASGSGSAPGSPGAAPAPDLRPCGRESSAAASSWIVGFQLPPPVEFGAYRSGRGTTTAAAAAATPSSALAPAPRAPPAVTSQAEADLGLSSSWLDLGRDLHLHLTSSSSQASLLSMRSDGTTSTASTSTSAASDEARLSDQARSELRAYARAFDCVRDWKRRSA